ncbi:DUF885 family protein [Aliikangiella sp. G2MR2-5]|uniref:DUF885 domain-containing protein n=1 Tax=Aliikangiella sp. G2MR2-5 TaxID=2788943 RepID=UPI0018A948B2|nr:DUF885 domain-containing protein [Aliikangiella sp. G2MR2-5]
MKKIVLWGIALLFCLIVIPLGAFAAHEWYGRPFFINNFFNRFALKIALDSPETLTSLKVLEQFGIDGHNGELDDASPESTDEFFKFISSEYEVLKTYSNEELTKEEKLSKRIAEYLFQFAKEAEEFKYHNYPVNQLFGVQNGFPTFMESQHQINDLKDAEYYVSRLHKLPRKFSQVVRGLKLRTENGIIPPQFVIERVVEEMQGFTETKVEENILYASLKEKLEKVEGIAQEDRDEILAKAKLVINEEVYPAYIELTRYFSGLSDKADHRDGFWKLPNGEKAYRLALKLFTSTDYSPDYLHNVGIQEVARIQAEILEILQAEGFDTTEGFTQSMKALSEQERFFYPDSDEGRQQILDDYQTIIDEIDAGLASAFNVRPTAKVKVERIPEFKEKTSPGAYYNAPSLDGSRPGIFYANLYDIKATPKYSMRTLAYHEAIPGHHFQITVAQELEGLPIFRRFSPFTAYVEGWALYAERLAWELGFQDNPYDNIGRLQAELFRAVRLVVDTGIHAKRWTRDEAITYMIKNTGMAESDVVAEIERYIVMPGQACAYKVGMIKILELRAKAKESLGDRFDLAEFHDVVLKNGAVPLDILGELVDEYIESKAYLSE